MSLCVGGVQTAAGRRPTHEKAEDRSGAISVLSGGRLAFANEALSVRQSRYIHSVRLALTRARAAHAGARGVRLRCYCSDCRGAAHHLGVAERALDADGSAAIYVTTAGALRIDAGQDQLAALRCTPKGPLRWYARCCNTPIANTLADPGLPFLSVAGACWADRDEADRVLGERTTGIFGKDIKATVDAHAGTPPWIVAGIIGRVALARLRGEQRRSPFRQPDSGEPIGPVELLSREQRQAAHAAANG